MNSRKPTGFTVMLMLLPVILTWTLVTSSFADLYTYTYTGSPFTTFVDSNFIPPLSGNVVSLTSVQGSVSYSSVLPADTGSYNSGPGIAGYSFSNGPTTFTEHDPGVLYGFRFVTAGGQIVDWNIAMQRANTSSTPDATGGVWYSASIGTCTTYCTTVGDGTQQVYPPPLDAPATLNASTSVLGTWTLTQNGSLPHAFFSSDGLYTWNGATWTLLTKSEPASMVTSVSALYASFPGDGLYSWNGSAWTLLTRDQPSAMVASNAQLYADFAGYGLYTWNGTAWTKLTGTHPQDMIASGSMLYAYFSGFGLYQWDGTVWTLLTRIHPQSMVASGTGLYAYFSGDGLYYWNAFYQTWSLLTKDQPTTMVASGSSLYADFPGWGVYRLDVDYRLGNWEWTRLTSSHPTRMVASSGSNLYADFAGDGLYKWDGSTWTKLTKDHPQTMMIDADFPPWVNYPIF